MFLVYQRPARMRLAPRDRESVASSSQKPVRERPWKLAGVCLAGGGKEARCFTSQAAIPL